MYTKNITLSADEHLIEAARTTARARSTTLNQMFRDWLVELQLRSDKSRLAEAEILLNRLATSVNAGRKFTRDEMNER